MWQKKAYAIQRKRHLTVTKRSELAFLQQSFPSSVTELRTEAWPIDAAHSVKLIPT